MGCDGMNGHRTTRDRDRHSARHRAGDGLGRDALGDPGLEHPSNHVVWGLNARVLRSCSATTGRRRPTHALVHRRGRRWSARAPGIRWSNVARLHAYACGTSSSIDRGPAHRAGCSSASTKVGRRWALHLSRGPDLCRREEAAAAGLRRSSGLPTDRAGPRSPGWGRPDTAPAAQDPRCPALLPARTGTTRGCG